MKLVVFEDNQSDHFHPISWLRGVFELKTGATTLTEKIIRHLGQPADGLLVRDYLAPAVRRRAVGVPVNDLSAVDTEDTLFVNARVGGADWKAPDGPVALWHGDQLALFRARGGVGNIKSYQDVVAAAKSADRSDYTGPWYNYIWDLMLANPEALTADFNASGRQGVEGDMHESAAIYGPSNQLYVGPNAKIHPFVCIDTHGGPVTIEADCEVHPYTRIEGPCYVGAGTVLLGAKVREGCSFGPMCRVGGEVEESIIHGFSNKYHDGFLGHAYVGEWVNLGALTTNSDLKNDYTSVSVMMNGRPVDTGSNKVGSFIGDHVKTSIGTLLNTGSHVGPMSILVAKGEPLPKYIPAYAWFLNGMIGKGFGLGPLLDTARIAMSRRKVVMDDVDQALLEHVYELTAEDRNVYVRRARKALAARQ
jgi:UDP-N-acetylglucosamine diphosphorylase/glucosamine-1-phosphate N-acetyltransferase